MKEQLHLLEKGQGDKSDEEERSHKNGDFAQLLRQQNVSLPEENSSLLEEKYCK